MVTNITIRRVATLFLLMALAPWASPLRAMGQGTASPASSKPDVVLQGDVHGTQNQSYVEVPFVVPAGVQRVTLEFSYTERNQHTALDLGLEDPKQLRCWSGGNKSILTVGQSDATPSCLPGSLPEGAWKLLIGVPNIRPAVISHYTANIFFTRTGLVADEPSLLREPLRGGPGWYRGDLHMHTGHSDGQCPNQSGKLVPCPVFVTAQAAAKRGLDFIAITDHNATSHYGAMRELQPYFDHLLLIPGREITTFQGHVNLLGTTQFLDFRVDGKNVADMETLFKDAQQTGALVSINHPAAPTGEICMGCGWTPTGSFDMHLVNAIEAVNGGSVDDPAPGVAFWKHQLDLGLKLTAIGGSDNHRPMIPLDQVGSIGRPTTVVYAEELSTSAILAGIRSGRVFVDLAGSPDRTLDMNATATSSRAVMGSKLEASKGSDVVVELHVAHCRGTTSHLLIDSNEAQPSFTQSISEDDQVLRFHWISDGQRHWMHAEIVSTEGQLLLLGNAIYLN